MKKSLWVSSIGFAILVGSILLTAIQPAEPSPKITTNQNLNTSTSLSGEIPLLSSTRMLQDFKITSLDPVASGQLFSDLRDVSKYAAPTDDTPSLLNDCGDSNAVELLKELNAQRTFQVVNQGTYPIIRTPNIGGWNALTARRFLNEPGVICGVASFMPFDVASDVVLWRRTCSSGAAPIDANGRIDPSFAGCLQAEEAISLAFGLDD